MVEVIVFIPVIWQVSVRTLVLMNSGIGKGILPPKKQQKNPQKF